MRSFLTFLLCIAIGASPAWSLTVKDLVNIEGEQDNVISGQGLVVGLLGTGDKKNALKDSMLRAWLGNSDLDLPSASFETKNVALVNVSGKLPPHAGKGQRISLQVSTLGDAKSLEGGQLLFTKLHFPGDDGHQQIIYATAGGPVNMGEGSPVTVGTVNGEIQTPVPSTVIKKDRLRLLLKKADYVDADRIARQINQHFERLHGQSSVAKALTAGIVEVQLPELFKSRAVSFIAEVKKVPVLFTDAPAKIIINRRSNMVMLNEKIEVSPFAFAYKDLNVVVGEGPKRAPNIDSQFVQNVGEGAPENTDLQNLVDALNAMRVNPRDLVEIIQYAHKIGAIHAELILE